MIASENVSRAQAELWTNLANVARCGTRVSIILGNFTSESAPSVESPAWLNAHRQSALTALDARALPTPDEEIWRYSRIDKLDLDMFSPVTPKDASTVEQRELPEAVSALLASIGVGVGVGDRSTVVVTRNGIVELIDLENSDSPEGAGQASSGRSLRVSTVDDWSGGEGFGSAVGVGAEVGNTDYFTLLNTTFTANPVLIDIPRGMTIDKPIVIVHWIERATSTTGQPAVFPRVVVRAGEQAEAMVVECLVSDDGVALVAPVTELLLESASNLRYVNVQLLGSSVWQLGAQYSRVERDATLRSTSVALGGDYARVATESHLVGTGSTSRLKAVYFGNDAQMHDFRTLQQHDAPKSTSDLLFKGALGATARSVYSGLIRVRKGAAGTNAFQTNRNLVLSQGAHADSVPNLEIEENDVRCSHASAVGPVDEDQRYYLESRGVPTRVAERLIVLGFIDELLEQIGIPQLHAHLRDVVIGKLDALDEKVTI